MRSIFTYIFVLKLDCVSSTMGYRLHLLKHFVVLPDMKCQLQWNDFFKLLGRDQKFTEKRPTSQAAVILAAVAFSGGENGPGLVGQLNGTDNSVSYWTRVTSKPNMPSLRMERTESAFVISSSKRIWSKATWGWPWMCWKYNSLTSGMGMLAMIVCERKITKLCSK